MSSKLYKIGTIYTRVAGLITKKNVRAIDKPIWFDVYSYFPPRHEPTFGRPAPETPVREILYQEDVLRAKLHKAYPHLLGAIDLESNEETNSQSWIRLYNEYVASGMTESEAIQKLEKSLDEMKPPVVNEPPKKESALIAAATANLLD